MLLATGSALGAWVWFLIGMLAGVGLLAMVSPQRFSRLAHRGSGWIDTNKYLSFLDKRVDIDQAVLPFSRVLGFAVLGSAVLWATLLLK